MVRQAHHERIGGFSDVNYLGSVYKPSFFWKGVVPAKTGIQFFQGSLDAPVLSTGQAPQVRHDGLIDFVDRLYLLRLHEYERNDRSVALYGPRRTDTRLFATELLLRLSRVQIGL